MTTVADLQKVWSEDPEYRAEYDRLGPEFALARSLIEARTRAQLTQAEPVELTPIIQSWSHGRKADGYNPRPGRLEGGTWFTRGPTGSAARGGRCS